MNTTAVSIDLQASRFVNVVLKHRWWAIDSLPDDDAQELCNTVSVAGFKPAKIVIGEVVRNIRDDKGNLINETFPVNSYSKFKVVDEQGNDDHEATGWLDCALSRVFSGWKQQKESRDRLIEVVAREIERSVPLKPIKLTFEGDYLLEKPPAIYDTYLVDHARDEHRLHSFVGIHQDSFGCYNGLMDRKPATKIQDALVCRNCGFQFLFPKEIKTYGELRKKLML